MESRTNCLGRVPYSALFGFIFIIVGGGVLCGTLYTAMSGLDSLFRLYFFPIYPLQYMRVASVVHGAMAIIFAILILIFSILVTNATRNRIYRSDRFMMGGRSSASLFICITYVAIIIWLFFVVLLVVPTFCWIMINSICSHEFADVWHGPGLRRPGPDDRIAPTAEQLKERQSGLFGHPNYAARLSQFISFDPDISEPSRTDLNDFSRLDLPLIPNDELLNRNIQFGSVTYKPYGLFYIFNLTNYGIYVRPWMYDKKLGYREAITNVRELARFCDEVAINGPLFACSLAGAMFVLLGLILFIGSLSTFYTRLKLTKELTDYRHSISLRSPKAHDQAAYF